MIFKSRKFSCLNSRPPLNRLRRHFRAAGQHAISHSVWLESWPDIFLTIALRVLVSTMWLTWLLLNILEAICKLLNHHVLFSYLLIEELFPIVTFWCRWESPIEALSLVYQLSFLFLKWLLFWHKSGLRENLTTFHSSRRCAYLIDIPLLRYF